MATVAQVAKASLQRILVQASEAAFEPDEYQDYIFALNNYMLALDAQGITLGFTQVYDLGDEVTVPVGALRGIIANMAIEVAPDYNGQITAGLQVAAMEGMAAMRLLGQHIGVTYYPCTLPVGSGNEGDTLRLRGDHYYPCTEDEILAETTGSISLEINTITASDAATPVEPEPVGPPMILVFAVGTAIPAVLTLPPWDGIRPTVNAAADVNVVTLPLPEFGEDGVTPLEYNFTVDWGDGTSDVITAFNDPAIAHTYADGTFTVTISGRMEGWRYGTFDFRDQLTEIQQWGTVHFKSVLEAFSGCRNLVVTATDLLDLLDCRSMSYMFYWCEKMTDCGLIDTRSIVDMNRTLGDCHTFNRDMTDWVVNQVTDFGNLFQNCTLFNGDVSNWHTGVAEVMSWMFEDADAFDGLAIQGWDVSSVRTFAFMLANLQNQVPDGFNPDLSAWDTSSATSMQALFNGRASFTGVGVGAWDVGKVLTMESMFESCDAFDVDLGGWNVSSVVTFLNMFSTGTGNSIYQGRGLENWDVSSAESMYQMFEGCDAFNGDIGGWNTSNVLEMHEMFHTLNTGTFNRDISGWDISKVEVIGTRNGFDTFIKAGQGTIAFSTANYDLLLNAWSLQTVQPALEMEIDANYTIATSQAARDVLTGAPNNWVITDKGGV